MTPVPTPRTDAEQNMRDALALTGLVCDNERASRAVKALIERANSAERELTQAAERIAELEQSRDWWKRRHEAQSDRIRVLTEALRRQPCRCDFGPDEQGGPTVLIADCNRCAALSDIGAKP